MTDYAKICGVSIAAIQDRIRRGTITARAITRGPDGKLTGIYSELADEDFKNRKSAIGEQADSLQRKKANISTIPNALDQKLDPLPKPEVITKMIEGKEVPVTEIPYAGEDNFDRYRKAKAGTEEIKARLLELELAEAEGRLLDIEDVKEQVTKACAQVRESLLNIPGKAAPELLACKDLVEIETKLYKEINQALGGISGLLIGS